MNINVYSKLEGAVKEGVDEVLSEGLGLQSGRTPEEMSESADKYHDTPFCYVVGEIDGIVVGSIELYKREINFNETKILMGGIGGVTVAIKYRGKGLSSQLMKRSMEILRESGIEVAYLCCNYDDPKIFHLYNSNGFEIYKKPVKYIGKSNKHYEEIWAMLANVNSKEKFDLLFNSPNGFDLQGSNW